jgi:nucleoside-diphosphate-sugar epimerase
MLRILVTGADGFVGRALVLRLRNDGHAVVAAVRRPDGPGTVAVGDIAGDGDWSTALSDVDVVVHLAARTHVMREWHADPMTEFRRVNVTATLRLAQAAAVARVQRFVFVSSIKVNGAGGAERCLVESDDPRPGEPYDISKWEAERSLVELGNATGMQITRVRPALVVGPGAKGNLLRLMRLVDLGIPLPLSRIDNGRNMVALENLCELLSLCATEAQAANQLYLAADAEPISTPDLLHYIAKGLGRKALLFRMPASMLRIAARMTGSTAELERMISSLRVSSEHARAQLHWRSQVATADAIISMARAYRLEASAPRSG